MPEVVEVCLTALWLNHELKGKKIKNIEIKGGRYSRHKLKGLDIFKKNKPFTIIKIDSKGKFMWFELENSKKNKYYILNRFGLTGEWGFTKYDHSNVLFKITNHDDLYFTDQRNFGTIEITDDVERLNEELEKMGPDFLKENFTEKEFYDRIENYLYGGRSKDDKMSSARANRKVIKVLMDQRNNTGIGSGLGNYLAPESLYKAGISPHTKMKDIYKDRALSNKLSKAIKYIVKSSFLTADIGYLEDLDTGMASFVKKIRKDVKKKPKTSKYSFHPDINLKNNEEFTFKVYQQKEDPYGNPVKADKIIKGRTTYWVPKKQN